ncbi:glycoside hydrolase family 15 protein [Bradyrhizobium guangzhouense]|uniref:Glycoside hydrolase family 15 protein n=1 Tax=Bradyrhizobium guangzhouense TaxID=1325095 RepID=A0AAE5WYD6_9BRAD|nr:glycoside hydrolase family 15 protein [Bradyrhizobium guangzhouense]QAU45351.1 glycoside hydrolase family 15 protein [Bradyrhizobium guangzhouense]RXH08608.1 glycoside hydrolase family 15 protein [Bradyrhizobium guangzhouense]
MSQRIEDYALIGDCETAALVGRNGSIDWLCWPAFDSDACFAAILGTPENGRWLIAPSEDVTSVSRRYLGDTLILETRFETEGGTVALVDFMPPRGKASDIVRLVRGVNGTVKMRMELIIRFGFGTNIPWVRRIDHSLLAVAGQDMTVLRSPIETRGEDLTTIAEFEIKAGETVPFVLTYGPSHLDPPERIDPDVALQETEKFWKEWSSRSTHDGEYRDLVMRSLITLKALTFGPTGGIVAAPTTSLPEKLGGSRNWDYRFCWLRDATFTLLALMNSGYTDEALAWHNWLLRAAAGAPANMQIMYGIWGQRRLLEWEASWLDGYEGAKPVRIGNAAHAQLQLDVYGELIDAFHQARMAKLQLDDEATWALECAVLNHLAEVWDHPDHGIWERRGQPRHYVFSKVMTWVAFDRAIKSAETFGFKAPLLHWRALREAIHRDVCNRGFDAEENAFVESYGSKMLDASVLLLPGVGFLPAHDSRIRGTIAAVEKRMMRDGFVLRHDPREVSEETQPIEGAFLACTLWLADAHVLAGDLDRAQALFDRIAGLANDVGLLAEEYDPVARRQAGNFPQALTHIALINTAHNLSAARHASEKPAMQRSK